jgi:hypothetical protein
MGSNPMPSSKLRVLCNGKTLGFQPKDRSSILLTRSNYNTRNTERLHKMSSYVQEAIQNSGINRTELTAVCAYMIRTKQATGQHDAIEQLASGQVDGAALTEQMIRSFQVEVEEEEIVELSGEDELRNLMREKTST